MLNTAIKTAEQPRLDNERDLRQIIKPKQKSMPEISGQIDSRRRKDFIVSPNFMKLLYSLASHASLTWLRYNYADSDILSLKKRHVIKFGVNRKTGRVLVRLTDRGRELLERIELDYIARATSVC
jgi:hypothetical protein